MDNNRNVRVIVGNRNFIVRNANPIVFQEVFIQEIKNDLSRMIGPIVNAVGPAAPNGYLRLIIDDISFDLNIQNQDDTQEEIIQKIWRILFHLGPIMEIDGPVINNAVPNVVPNVNNVVPNINPVPNVNPVPNINHVPNVNPVTNVNHVVPNINYSGPIGDCREAFECPVCREEYSNDRQPTTLPCGHSLCMIDAPQINSRRCPICRSPFVFENQRMSVSLMDASLSCATFPTEGGRLRRRCKTKRRGDRTKRRRCKTKRRS